MTWFDGFAALILLALAVRGYSRGLILQLSAFVAVAIGLLGGIHLHSAAATLLPDLGHPVLTLVAGFTVVFVVIALCVNLLARALKTAVDALFLGLVDRLLGALLGLLLGVQILLVIVLLVGRYLPDGMAWLETTRTAPLLSGLLEWVLPLMPDGFIETFERHADEAGRFFRDGSDMLRDGSRILREGASQIGEGASQL